ncbi:MAG: lysophospholipid acyltransferase family protein [Halochromatium sp.]
MATLLHALVRQILRGPFRLQASGTEQIPPSGACLLTPNHLSAVDPGAILAVLDHARRRTTCWGGATAILFNRPWMRLLSRSMRVLPVDPGGKSADQPRPIANALQARVRSLGADAIQPVARHSP